MADFRELFTSPDFEAYQSLIVDEVVGWLQDSITGLTSAQEIKTGMDVSHRILNIPAKLKATLQIEQKLQAAVKARLIEIPAELFRRELKQK
jgi:hypothetical protein